MQIHVTGVRYIDGRPADIYLYTSRFAHDSMATSLQSLIEACARLDDGFEVPTRVTIKALESSKSPWGPRTVALCHLPFERPLYNASRIIFSRWERDSQHNQTDNQTSNEKAFKDFEDTKKMTCALDGLIAEMR